MKWLITKTLFDKIEQIEFDDKKKNDLDVAAANNYVESLMKQDKLNIDSYNASVENDQKVHYSNFSMQPVG